MHSRKGSKVNGSCPNCREFVTQKSTGSRKEAWIECPKCGEVFEAKEVKSSRRERVWEEEEDWALVA